MLLRKEPPDKLAIDRLQKAETHLSWLSPGSLKWGLKWTSEVSPQKSENITRLGLPQGAGTEAALGRLAGLGRSSSQCCTTPLNTMYSLSSRTNYKLVSLFAGPKRPSPLSPASSDDQLPPFSRVVSCGLIIVA